MSEAIAEHKKDFIHFYDYLYNFMVMQTADFKTAAKLINVSKSYLKEATKVKVVSRPDDKLVHALWNLESKIISIALDQNYFFQISSHWSIFCCSPFCGISTWFFFTDVKNNLWRVSFNIDFTGNKSYGKFQASLNWLQFFQVKFLTHK